MNPKTLQYIMGHSDIGVTLNTYTHLQFDDALEEMKELSLKETKKVCNGQWAKSFEFRTEFSPFDEKVMQSYSKLY